MAKIDSLLRVANSNPDDNVVIHAYHTVSIEYVYSFPDQSKTFIFKALEKAEKINNQQKVAESYRLLGTTYWAQYNPQQAMEYFLKALRKYEDLNDSLGIANCFGNIGLVYAQQKEYDEAMTYHQKALEIQKQLKNIDRIAVNQNNIGDIYLHQKNYELAIVNYQNSLKNFTISGNLPGVILNKINLSEVLLAQNKYQQALDSSLIHYNSSEKTKNRRLMIRSMRCCAEAYLGLERIKEAEECALKSAELMEKTNLKQFTRDIYTLLSKVYQKKGDYEKAFNYWYLQDSIFNKEQDFRITSYRLAYENEKKEKEIVKLQHIQEAQENYFIIAAIVGVLLLIILILSLFGLWHNKKLNQKLSLKNKEIQLQNTQINQKQEEILMQSERLKDINDVKDKLFSIVSHDLKNPINSLKSVIFLFEHDAITPEEIKGLMKNLKKEVLIVEDTLSNLLLWAKNQMTLLKTEKEAFNLKNIVEESFKLVESAAFQKKISLNTSLEEAIIRADINQMRLIVRNLVSNAVKFTNEGGEVMVSGENEEAFWKISIKDNGIGMSEEEVSRLFHIKTHFTKQGTGREKGTGLGLLLCKEFIENHNGKIWVESSIGKGSTFHFTIVNQD
jgi:signal transduction histidine kinase